jgi:hypothetical protein
MDSALYEQDFVCWTEEQARAIRDAAASGVNLPIDWENIAEEIDSLGRSQRTELRNRIRNIIVHLMKLEASPATEPRRGWEETVLAQRGDIQTLLDDSPSLRREVTGMIARALSRARYEASQGLALRGEQPRIDLEKVQYSEAQVLGDWFPEQPPPLSRARPQRRRKSSIEPK